MRLVGVAEYATSEFPLAADMNLQDWKLSWRADDDAAAKQAKKAKTLDELRRLLKAE
jgi:hypothetical protein